MPLGRARPASPQLEKVIGKEFDRRRPITSPTFFASDSVRPDAKKNKRRIIFVRQADGTFTGQYSDGANWQSFLATSVSYATPTITYGTTAAAGSSTKTIRSDATLKYPAALMSAANSATLTLTDDGTQEFITGSLGNLSIEAATGGLLFFESDATANITANVRINASSGNNRFGLQTIYTSAALSSASTVTGWNVNLSHSAQMVSSTFTGYDMTTFSFAPGASSDSANVVYGARFAGPAVSNATGGFTEVAALYLTGARRVGIPAVTATAAYGAAIECPTISTTAQAGIYIKQRTAQQTATTRYGILIDAHNSGTTRWAIHADGDASHFAGLDMKDATNIVLATGTGTKIGTATTQKLGFWNVAPVIQPATTGTASTMVAGGGAAVDDKATFTGGTGATAYRIDDVVLGLKQCGILKA